MDTEVIKAAASRLRSMVRLVEETPSGALKGVKFWSLKKGPEVLGYVHERRGQVFSSKIHPKWRGLGLGKKMYGDLARKYSGGISSDSYVSEAPQTVWQGILKTDGPMAAEQWLQQRADEKSQVGIQLKEIMQEAHGLKRVEFHK